MVGHLNKPDSLAADSDNFKRSFARGPPQQIAIKPTTEVDTNGHYF